MFSNSRHFLIFCWRKILNAAHKRNSMNWDFKIHFNSDWTRKRQQPTENGVCVCECLSIIYSKYICCIDFCDASLFTTYEITARNSINDLDRRRKKRIGVATIVEKRTNNNTESNFLYTIKSTNDSRPFCQTFYTNFFCNATTMKMHFKVNTRCFLSIEIFTHVAPHTWFT